MAANRAASCLQSPSIGGGDGAISPAADYAPSPNTCHQALMRANQLRVQALLRQLLIPPTSSSDTDHVNTDDADRRLNALRVLKRTMRELGHQLSWLTQVDFFETIERILRNETLDNSSNDHINWRLIHDISQLIIETLPKCSFEPDATTLSQVCASAVQNLGHQRSEVRRVSLLLINMLFNDGDRKNFANLLHVFIDYGLANERNKQAQRGAILSLPLLMSEQVAKGQDLSALIRCLCELLVEAEPQLFYSLYLALQRLHMTLGDHRFYAYLRQCSPDAIMLYKQAASRSGSMEQPAPPLSKVESHAATSAAAAESAADANTGSDSKQVTFEAPDDKESLSGSLPAEVATNDATLAGDFTSCASDDDDDTSSLPSSVLRRRPSGDSTTTEFRRSQQQQQEVYSKMMDNRSTSVSSTCSSDAHLVNPAHYMSAAALSGRPMADYDQVHHIDHSANLGLAINDLCVSCSPTTELACSEQNELKYGIFPRYLVNTALNSARRYLDRLEALEKMMCIVRDSPINHLAILMTYFDSFMGEFLAKLMENGTDYKLELIAIDMIETIVIKTKVSSMQYIRPLVGLLVKCLSDTRAIFRDNSVRVIHKMMAYLPPQHVIDAIFEHKHSKSTLVREESVNRVTAAVLDYDKNEFNLTKLCYHVLPMLADSQASVRLAALECIATLAHALGPERIGSLLTAAEAVQTGCDYDGLLDAINARIMRRTLPRCNADGSIRYVIRPFLAPSTSAYHQEQQAADVRWVLEAPSRHQHHPAPPSVGVPPEVHHAHRPGAYSPEPAGAGRSRRRSVPAALAANIQEKEEQHHHHHHHHQMHHHQQQQQQQQQPQKQPQKRFNSSQNSQEKRVDPATEMCADGSQTVASEPATGPQRQQAPTPEAGRKQQRDSCSKQQRSSAGGDANISEIEIQRSRLIGSQTTSSRDSDNNNAKVETTVQQKPPSAKSDHARRYSRANDGNVKVSRQSSKRRSCSQDSNSSTDTNKVLFQYYLDKFKQSLEDSTGVDGMTQSALLPSDSIIYTDVVEVYKLSRHKSRQQQTSFDYDTSGPAALGINSRGLVGPDSGSALSVYRGQIADNYDNDDDMQQQQRRQPSDDPLGVISGQRRHYTTDRAGSGASSGSESPQTIMEQQQPLDSAISGRTKTGGPKQQDSLSRGDTGDDRSRPEVEARSGTESGRRRRKSRPSMEQQQQQEIDKEANKENSGGESDERCPPPEGASSALGRSHESVQRDTPSEPGDAAGPSCSGAGRGEQRIATNGPRGRGLVRQSASAAVANYDGDQELPDTTGAVPSSSPPPPDVGASGSGEPSPPAIAMQRHDSTGTTDSRSSSQRECSDHATQTTPLSERRASRRRRSGGRRASSQRRESAGNGSRSHDDSDGPGGRGRETVAAANNRRDHQEEKAVSRRRASRSQPPARAQLSRASSRAQLYGSDKGGATAAAAHDARRSVSVSPSVATNVNIRHILENVAQNEGSFQEPQLALRVAMEALASPCWSTKVEGLLALIRLVSFHQQTFLSRLHEIVCRVANETRNLRSTVARSAIFALGDFCANMEKSIEPELDTIVQALLQKSIENTAFIRDDIRRALATMVDHLTHWRLATLLIVHGAGHKNMHVRRMAGQFLALLVQKMGPAKCLVGARDISAKLIPAAAKFAQDSSPHNRYYGRLILARIMQHSAFDRLLRKTLVPNLYRSTIGIVESIKRRGVGESPIDA